MKRFFLFFFLLPLFVFSSSEFENFSQKNMEVTPSVCENIPAFDSQKALLYLTSLYSFLESIGGNELYSVMKEKSDEERKAINEELSQFLAPIVLHLEKKGKCGGLGSIGLVGLFLSLDDLLCSIANEKEEKNISAKIVHFFRYLGCNDTIFSLFQ